nr:hypothetical protein BdHM001_05710 [Bdellovibrio sp. HM001]
MNISRLTQIILFSVTAQLVPVFAVGGLKFGFNPSNAPPLLYQFENNGNPIPTGGLIYEVSVAIGDELGEDYTIERIPRKRIAQQIVENRVDLICHNSTRWRHEFADNVLWSTPLFTTSNVLVSTTAIPFEKVSQITGITIGTVENYVYADLEDRFNNKELQRSDSASIEVSVKKLLNDRVSYIILAEPEYIYFKSRYPRLVRSSFSFDQTDIQCSLSRKSSLSLDRLNRAIANLHRKKVLQRILERYSNSATMPQPFSYGLNSNDSPPFIFFEKNGHNLNRVRGGLFFDIGREIAKKLRRPVHFELLPRGRLDARLAAGLIEMVCYDNEAWAGEYAKQYQWSQPIFRQSDLIVSLRNDKADTKVRSLEDLKGKRLGTVLNFVYPALSPLFENRSVLREDASSGASNLEKLFSQRIPFIVLNNLEYQYYESKHPHLQRAALEVDPVDVKCAVSKKADLKIQEVDAAIRELQSSGRMQKIFSPPYEP